MKNLTQLISNLIVKVDIILDNFWVRVVLYKFHRKVSEMYFARAADLQDHHIKCYLTVPTERLRKLRHQAQRHALEAKLIKEMFV